MSTILKRNTPYDAWPKDIKKFYVPKGGSISFTTDNNMDGGLATLPEEYVIMPAAGGRTLFDGRYCAVSGFVFSCHRGQWRVLANKRGEGAPDYKHCWNVVCGFLEANETAEQGISREVEEETGYVIFEDLWKFQGVETDPAVCNNGNVSLRFTTVLNFNDLEAPMKEEGPKGGEVDEVESVKWIPLDDLDSYKWAFNHRDLIPEMFSKLTWVEKTVAYLKSWIQ